MQLAPAISFCTVEGRPVFLDIARDRYFCLGGKLEAAWKAIIAGSSPADEAERLVRQGLVVPARGQLVEACSDAIAPTSLLDVPPTPASAPRLVALAWTLAHTRWRLKRLGLGALAASLNVARQRPTAKSPEPPSLAAIACDFERLGLLTSAHDLCLPRSLALGLYLLRRGYAPEVVLGVRLGPFRAHCWVECEDALVNDRLERVRHYTPICRL